MVTAGTGGVEGEIQVKMILSADDFGRVLERMGFSSEQATGMAAGGGEERIRGKPVNLEKSIRTSPTFMSIFKPVAALMGINLGIQGVLGQSRIAGTYLGAMGKMFGAAIDLLLMPFIPLFNVLMIGMSMLVKWLITSGVLEKISEGVIRFMNFVKNEIWPPLQELVEGIKEMNPGKIAGAIWDLGSTTMKAWMQSLVRDPLLTIAGTLASMLVLQRISGFLGVGGGKGGVPGGGAVPMLLNKPMIGATGAVIGGLSAYDLATNQDRSRNETLRDIAGTTAGGATLGGSIAGPPGAIVGTGLGLGVGVGMEVSSQLYSKAPAPWVSAQTEANRLAAPSTFNVVINTSDPWVMRQELERMLAKQQADAGREGKP
jgi:hypothetical protein